MSDKFKNGEATLWDFLALSDEELERADLVAMNLSVARGIESQKNIDVEHYCRIVDNWTKEFSRRLPGSERTFKKNPQKFENDIRFYHMGMLQLFLSSVIGIRYNPEEKHAKTIEYTEHRDLFLDGVIDNKIGSCANMAALHVAIARRLGWPVSIALAKSHQLSRFDDGKVSYNIEASNSSPNTFAFGSDKKYIDLFKLPSKATAAGADLRKLTAREMMGVFIANRARHYQDIDRPDLCDADCSLARNLIPTHRSLYCMSMLATLERGKELFESEEMGHPKYLHGYLGHQYGKQPPVVTVATPSTVKSTEPIKSSLNVSISKNSIKCKKSPAPRLKPFIPTIITMPMMAYELQKKG